VRGTAAPPTQGQRTDLRGGDPKRAPPGPFTGVGAGMTLPRSRTATRPVVAPPTVRITATLGSRSAGASLTLLPSPLVAVRVDPDRVPGGSAAQGSVVLNSPAPPGGLVVLLASDHPGVARPPPSVQVPAGATEARFRVSSSA